MCHGGWRAEGSGSPGAKFKEWGNSAHGNHFFKYMEYDTNGNLVWKKDGKRQVASRPRPRTRPSSGTEPGAMTTFEFGHDRRAEGSHYSKSCTGCHTTGNKHPGRRTTALTMSRDGRTAWTFPDLKTAFGGDAVTTAAPNMTAYERDPGRR